MKKLQLFKIFNKNKLFLVFFLLSSTLLGQSTQHLQYSYDDNGNRTKRKYFAFRLADSTNLSVYQPSISQITVEPNPTSDQIKISIFPVVEGEIYNSQLYDEQGKLLFRNETTESELMINIENFNMGVYYLKISSKKMNQVFKIIKI
jgi:hypothetical protein